MSNKNTRYFKLVYDDAKGSSRVRFSGKTPKQVANIAFSSIFRNSDDPDNLGELSFCIIECTRGSECKKYFYTGERKTLTVPMEITIGKGDNKEVITYKYQNIIREDIVTEKKELEEKRKKEIYDRLIKWADSINLPTVGSNDIDIIGNIDGN